LTYWHPTCRVFPALLQVFPHADIAAIPGPFPDVVALAAHAEGSFGAALLVDIALVLALEVLSQGCVALAAHTEGFSAADVAEPQVSDDIVPAIDVSFPVSVAADEADSSGRPRFSAFPNIYFSANCSSSVEVVGGESVHSSTDVRTNHELCSVLANPDLHQNKNGEHCYNKPSLGYNNGSDTNGRPINATTTHSRKRGLL
jgi:hypothetical protein